MTSTILCGQMRVLSVALAFAVACCCCAVAVSAEQQTVVVGSMNIQVFGPSTAANKPVMELLVRILQRFDIFAIQEIRDTTNTAFPALIQQLNANVTGVKTYAYVIGSRQGRSNSKEQYAFVYDTAKFEVLGLTYEYPVALDNFERPPFAAQFAVTGYQGTVVPPFVLVNVHTTPSTSATPAEIDALADVYDAVVANMSNPNVLTMGDFNAGSSYVSRSAWANIRFRTQQRFTWLIPDSADTTMGATSYAYDRMVVAGADLTAALVNGTAGTFEYAEAWNISTALALDVSDHKPIQVTLTVATQLNAAARAGGESLTVALVAALVAAATMRFA